MSSVVPDPALNDWVPLWNLAPAKLSYGTTLPASPVDGQETILVDSITAPTYQWHLRYNAGSTSGVKWECIGGSWANATVEGSTAATGSLFPNFVDLGGPSIIVPRPGDYVVNISAGGNCTIAGSAPMIAVRVGASGYLNGSLSWSQTYTAGAYVALAKTNVLVNAPTAGLAITLVYCAYTAGTSTYDRRTISVMPQRLA